MNKRLRALQLQQMEDVLGTWRAANLPARPSTGWSRAIRETLGMPATALAARVGMSSAGIRKLETAEAQQVISLTSLRKLAEALDCELQYALVPREPLETRLKRRAFKAAEERMRPVSHSMSLEDQSVTDTGRKVQLELLAKELLDGSWRALW
ncbi:MAG: transcriptional regulator [Comamonadaceae bacterium CG12_big_fil_rev_8_21_14_0_65_59_15]|nr:MAG: transcriptional regulator [Comamonadaceae bacterium CG12_big_fil_rev_8_21_14_0_65_59_15]